MIIHSETAHKSLLKPAMPFSILPFDAAPPATETADVEEDDADGDTDLGDDLGLPKRTIVTPGQTITSDAQFMRYTDPGSRTGSVPS